jgi:hypothetical protein
MFGDVGLGETAFIIIFSLLSLILPIVILIITARWARRVRIALEQIAANTSR